MKNRIYIILALAAATFASCSTESQEPDIAPETRGLMDVEITEKTGLSEDRMERVRFIVFKNGLVNPELELNELFDIPDINAGDKEVSKFKITLELKQKAGGVNEKLVFAIINEPVGMTSGLDAIVAYSQLEDVGLDLTDFLNGNYTALANGKLMPMTGVILTNNIYGTPEEAENNPVTLEVHRAVARVDVYLSQEPGSGLELGTGTKISLDNTYTNQYLVRNEDGPNVYGKIQTVDPSVLEEISWSWTTGDDKELPDYSATNKGRLVCSFYTPERTCTAAGDADKLVLTLEIVTNEGAKRTGKVVIDKFNLEGIETNVNNIIRNNAYRVYSRIGVNDITSSVLDWNDENIEVEF